MRRREFIALLSGAPVAWPLTARAQQSTMPTVGLLGFELEPSVIAGVRQGLSESGYVEGQNVAMEYRSAEGRTDRLPALIADLIHRQVTVIIAFGTPAAAAAKVATATIPIVFNSGADPIAAGFVASLNRPGGNLTGVTVLLAEIVPKHFELMREMVPTASTIAFLYNPTNRTLAEPITREAQEAAHSLGFKLHVLQASTEREIDDAFAKLDSQRPDGLVIGPDVFFYRPKQRARSADTPTCGPGDLS